ncbi:hypothetical protein SAMN02982919_01034 [Giesbergeria anulus]|uniref:Uncharacterized protein n=1 Tax=Giesbergeria anulus TaxID=180197 RepID=A0A1H9I6P9_9BURK|nr:hypothetical protein SAMN02982919_01034 [Giesbergeria anulus]
MSMWAERAKAHFSQTPPERTDETDKTPLSSVLSVPSQHFCEKTEETFGGFVGFVSSHLVHPEKTALLATAPDWTPPAPLPDPGMARLLALAMTLCDRTGASEKTRQDWRADIEQTPHGLRGGLYAHLLGQLPPPHKPMPPAVVAVPSTPAPAPAPTWREADKADQSHHWSCAQCRTGAKCPEGQRLSDAYIEAASRERFIAAKTDPAKPLPKFHVAQPGNKADKTYQAHHWSCDACKAYARSNGHGQRCIEGQQLHSAYEQAAAK